MVLGIDLVPHKTNAVHLCGICQCSAAEVHRHTTANQQNLSFHQHITSVYAVMAQKTQHPVWTCSVPPCHNTHDPSRLYIHCRQGAKPTPSGASAPHWSRRELKSLAKLSASQADEEEGVSSDTHRRTPHTLWMVPSQLEADFKKLTL